VKETPRGPRYFQEKKASRAFYVVV